MGYIKYAYVGPKNVQILQTTNNTVDQIWQQLVQLRHVSKLASTFGTPTNYYLIDQAKTYFLDAALSNWRSGGLLYYYSYLNLAKALLHSRGTFVDTAIRSSNILHGLSADPQQPDEIVAFKVTIWPKSANGKTNVFSTLYDSITASSWPFSVPITIEVREVIGYCEQIAYELADFYSTIRAMQIARSLLRTSNDKSQVWYEILVPDASADLVASEIESASFAVVRSAQFSTEDREEWFEAYDITNAVLNHMALIRSPSRSRESSDARALGDLLYRLAIPSPVFHSEEQWNFVPRIVLSGHRMYWHPLLSDYLFSFVLSTILRYYPHLLTYNQRSAFLAQAWCKQSAQVALRYFLLEFTDPSVVMKQV